MPVEPEEQGRMIPAGMVPDDARQIMERLESAGYEAYLVGGCVRDMLIGRTPSDYDITTNAEPDQTEAVFSDQHTLGIGKKHGTIGVVMPGGVYEVTTYRIDGEYTDHRRPDSVTFTRSLIEDLKRRDFTINAMAMDLRGKIIGVVHSREDLENGIIRAVGDPDRRFQEDALRIMRGIRFAAQLQYRIEEETGAALIRNKALLQDIAAERIRVELDKLLVSENPVPVLREYREVIAEILPELRAGFDFNQQNPFHCYDVYEHILHAVEQVPPDRVLRLAALLHDVGKPACFIVRDGWGHFYGHEHKSAEMTDEAMRRLKYDNRTREIVTGLVKAHGTVFNPTEKYARKKINRLGADQLLRLIQLERADVSAQAEAVRAERVRGIGEFREIVERVLAGSHCFSQKDLAVNGSDIIAIGVPEGPLVGKILKELLEKVLDEETVNERDALLKEAEVLKSRYMKG